MARTEWNPVFQIVFVFKKKVRGFFSRYLNLRKRLPLFFVFSDVFKEMLMFELDLGSHFPGAHGEFGDGALAFTRTSLAAGAFLVIFSVPTVVDNFERIRVRLYRVLVLRLHAFK